MFGFIARIGTAFNKKMTHDATPAYASDTTLFMVISFFPFLMFLLALLRYLPFTQEELMALISGFVPSQVAAYIEKLVDELYTTSGAFFSVTIVVTLWTASRGILGMYRGLNSVYGIEETRNYFLIRLRAMLYTFVFAIMLILLLGLYVFGNQIIIWLGSLFPHIMMNRYTILVISFRTTIGILILLVLFTIMYIFMPNRKTRLIKELPGAVFASVGWVGFSYLYSIYIDHMGSMKATYGSLAAIVLCVFWLYACVTIFFIGAEINSFLDNPGVRNSILNFFKHKKTASPEAVIEDGTSEVLQQPQH